MPGRPPPERQCAGTSRQTGQRCEQWTTPGRNVCHSHGGATPRGRDLPQFKHGRYSKAIPDRFSERYEVALTDQERHDLRDEISASEAKVYDLFFNMRHGESDSAWLKLQSLERKLAAAQGDKRPPILGEILSLIQAGSDALAWNDVERWMARKQKLVETDMRVAKEKQEMVSAEEVMAMITALLDAVRKNVEDEGTRRAISEDIRRVAEGRETGVVVPIRRDDSA